jgi:hypothetical protein
MGNHRNRCEPAAAHTYTATTGMRPDVAGWVHWRAASRLHFLPLRPLDQLTLLAVRWRSDIILMAAPHRLRVSGVGGGGGALGRPPSGHEDCRVISNSGASIDAAALKSRRRSEEDRERNRRGSLGTPSAILENEAAANERLEQAIDHISYDPPPLFDSLTSVAGGEDDEWAWNGWSAVAARISSTTVSRSDIRLIQ